MGHADAMPIHTEILIYDHFEELDALGPYDVLRKAGLDVALVTAEPTDRIVAGNGTIGGLLDGRPATTHHDDLDDLEGKARHRTATQTGG
jgi:putative intracellular protease/amidase